MLTDRPIGTESISLCGGCWIWRVIQVCDGDSTYKDIEEVGQVRGFWKHYNDGRIIPLYSWPSRIVRQAFWILGNMCLTTGRWFRHLSGRAT